MKRFLAFTLAFLMVCSAFLLASCEKKPGSDTSDTSSEPELSNLETLKLSLEKLGAMLPTPENAFGIKAPKSLSKTEAGTVDFKLTLDELSLPEDTQIPEGPISLAAKIGRKDGKTAANLLLEMFGEALEADLIGDTDNSMYLSVKNLTEKPIYIPTSQQEDSTQIDVGKLLEDLKKMFTEDIDWETKVAVESAPTGAKTIRVGLNDKEIRDIFKKINDLLGSALGNLMGGGEGTDSEGTDIITPADGELALDLEIKTYDNTPSSVLLTASTDGKANAKFMLTVNPIADTSKTEFKFSFSVAEEEGEELKEMLNATLVSEYSDKEQTLTVNTEITVHDVSMNEEEYDTVTFTMNASFIKETDSKVTYRFDSSAKMVKGSVSAELASPLSGDGSTVYSETGTEEKMNLNINIAEEFSCKAALELSTDTKTDSLTITVPEDFVPFEDVDTEELTMKLAETNPIMASLLQELLGGSDVDESIYYSSEEMDLALICYELDDVLYIETICFNYLTYTDDGKELTFFNEDNKKLFALPVVVDQTAGTATIHGTVCQIFAETEDPEYSYVDFYADQDIDVMISIVEGDNTASVTFSALLYDGEKLIKQFPDGTSLSWDISFNSDLSTIVLDGTELSIVTFE